MYVSITMTEWSDDVKTTILLRVASVLRRVSDCATIKPLRVDPLRNLFSDLCVTRLRANFVKTAYFNEIYLIIDCKKIKIVTKIVLLQII